MHLQDLPIVPLEQVSSIGFASFEVDLMALIRITNAT